MENKVSPLKLLASLHQESKIPTKVTPKLKTNGEIKEVILEPRQTLDNLAIPPTIVRDNSFILNLNINMDATSIKETVVKTTELLSDIATGASFLSKLIKKKSPEEAVPPVKIPVIPKIKIPKL